LARFQDRAVLFQGSYRDAKRLLAAYGVTKLDGILLDLGFSTPQVDDSARGFSFQQEGPLDMRYDQTSPLTAHQIVNTWSEDDLARLFRQYGEEARARPLAQAIIRARNTHTIETTTALATLVASLWRGRGKIHPATRVFQALRIAVNNELEELIAALPELCDLLAIGGRLVVISFHSLEDRIVKQFFLTEKRLEILTPHVQKPKTEEIRHNPRARSAKLRAAVRVR
jgi:16S rRNA (cytosine1402-N4)-methyltransferase